MTDDHDPTDLMGPDPFRDRLRAADPAAGLTPPPDRWTIELAEAVMSTEQDHRPDSVPTARRRWLVPAAAAALVVVLGIGLGVALRPGDDPTGPSAAPSVPTSPTSPTTSSAPAGPLVLSAGGLQAGRCRAVSAEALTAMPTAFEGVVLSVEGRDATLRVVRWWVGSAEQRATTTVVVRGMTPELTELVAGVDLRPGGRYLVTATSGGEVSACGFSAPWSQRLEQLYAAAFGG